jgi:hypothetical protein
VAEKERAQLKGPEEGENPLQRGGQPGGPTEGEKPLQGGEGRLLEGGSRLHKVDQRRAVSFPGPRTRLARREFFSSLSICDSE